MCTLLIFALTIFFDSISSQSFENKFGDVYSAQVYQFHSNLFGFQRSRKDKLEVFIQTIKDQDLVSENRKFLAIYDPKVMDLELEIDEMLESSAFRKALLNMTIYLGDDVDSYGVGNGTRGSKNDSENGDDVYWKLKRYYEIQNNWNETYNSSLSPSFARFSDFYYFMVHLEDHNETFGEPVDQEESELFKRYLKFVPALVKLYPMIDSIRSMGELANAMSAQVIPSEEGTIIDFSSSNLFGSLSGNSGDSENPYQKDVEEWMEDSDFRQEILEIELNFSTKGRESCENLYQLPKIKNFMKAGNVSGEVQEKVNQFYTLCVGNPTIFNVFDEKYIISKLEILMPKTMTRFMVPGHQEERLFDNYFRKFPQISTLTIPTMRKLLAKYDGEYDGDQIPDFGE